MKIYILILLLCSSLVQSQRGVVKTKSYWSDKEYNKDVALFNSKDFLFNYILGITEKPLKFEVIPLASATSGELTTLIYKCESKNLEGLVLGFWGIQNENGNLNPVYSFRNFDKEKAIEFLNKIQQVMDENKTFLYANGDNNNVVFKFEDVDVLIFYGPSGGMEIRIFWSGFDSTWEKTAFGRSKRRFEKRIK